MADEKQLGPVPEKFDTEKRYYVQLSESVAITPSFMLQPADSHLLEGAYAETIRDKIVAAAEA